MRDKLAQAVADAAKKLFNVDVESELTRPEEKFGDYATNAALQLAAKTGDNPRQIADKIAEELRAVDYIESVDVAGPGFINFRLTDESLAKAAANATDLPQLNKDKQILVEFGDPNPFKEMHIGHLYSYIVGDAISSLLEKTGADVKRLSYHGDIGLHIAKAMYYMLKEGINRESVSDPVKVDIGLYYAKGAQAYEKNENAREEIHKINEHLYKRDNKEINDIYEWGKERSFAYFELILRDLGIKSDKQFFESETEKIGIDIVRSNIGKVFKESEGAIIYEGEKVGLHTRVFITSKGLPTYETKDLGLAELKKTHYPNAAQSIIITANEQAEYFKVMLSALSEIDKPLADSITHLSHGFVSLNTGKMSSRTGSVYSGVSAMLDIKTSIEKLYPEASLSTQNAAIKYDFLKHRLGSDIVYDIEESFNLQGNSGPYLQYAHARACSLIEKAKTAGIKGVRAYNYKYNETERSLALKISEYPEVVALAINELMPHTICAYLYELAQTFNRFYENNRVIGEEREIDRIGLVADYVAVLRSGLSILNIEAPERM